MALLEVPVPSEPVRAAIESFQTLRHMVSGLDILVAWLAYVWGVRDARNPLLAEIGVPSAVLMEYALGSAEFDLSPGLASRSSCPEAIWQAARWWYGYYASRGEADGETGRTEDPARPITGTYCVAHVLGGETEV